MFFIRWRGPWMLMTFLLFSKKTSWIFYRFFLWTISGENHQVSHHIYTRTRRDLWLCLWFGLLLDNIQFSFVQHGNSLKSSLNWGMLVNPICCYSFFPGIYSLWPTFPCISDMLTVPFLSVPLDCNSLGLRWNTKHSFCGFPGVLMECISKRPPKVLEWYINF